MRNTATLASVFVGVSLVAVANAAGPLRGGSVSPTEVTLVRTDQNGLVRVEVTEKVRQPSHYLKETVNHLKEFGFVIVRGRVTAEGERTCRIAIDPGKERRFSVGCTPGGALATEQHDTAADAVMSVKGFVREERKMDGTAFRRSWPMIVG